MEFNVKCTVAACFPFLMLIAGCGQSPSGPVRFTVSGNITYNGSPVPAGTILFEPDSEKGNSGPGGSGTIENGRFETFPGKGVVGGPYIVRIRGFTGEATSEDGEVSAIGNPLFPVYVTRVDFAKQNVQMDFDIPAQSN